MKKILTKDKNRRVCLEEKKKKSFVLQIIIQSSNFSNYLRWNAFQKFKELNYKESKSMLTNRCIETINKKRYNKLTYYSRHFFLKLVRSGKLSGFRKAVW